MVLGAPLPKSLLEANIFHANPAECVTAGSDAADGAIAMSGLAPVKAYPA
jgi:hypothetical protein